MLQRYMVAFLLTGISCNAYAQMPEVAEIKNKKIKRSASANSAVIKAKA